MAKTKTPKLKRHISRGSVHQGARVLLGTFVHPEFAQLISSHVVAVDSDVSKFMRQAAREKLARDTTTAAA